MEEYPSRLISNFLGFSQFLFSILLSQRSQCRSPSPTRLHREKTSRSRCSLKQKLLLKYLPELMTAGRAVGRAKEPSGRKRDS